ncbi:MAG: MFS transporter [Treponema sp.]|jgi:MFS-type transporter involved in bile tolerance (Atg22 family)|nr:MFS transporter [Treponema sp.]
MLFSIKLPKILRLASITLAIASFLGPAIAGTIRQKTGSYTGSFLCILVVAAATIFFLLMWDIEKKSAGHRTPVVDI